MRWFRQLALLVMLGPLSVPSVAAAGGALCTSRNGMGLVQKTGTDGSSCSADASDMSTSIAKAKGANTSANSLAESAGKASANAAAGAAGKSHALAEATTSGVAKATAANGSSSEALASATGLAISKANGGGSSAYTQASAHCIATSTGKTGGGATASCANEQGVGKATASDGGDAGVQSHSSCEANAIAAGVGSQATSICRNPDSTVISGATGGGLAAGDDQYPSQCTGGSGVAYVCSPMGNCCDPNPSGTVCKNLLRQKC